MQVTVYGGAGEIGGNIISLINQKDGTHILLDFGKNYSTYSKYYSWTERPKRSVETELRRPGILPVIRDPKGQPLETYVELNTHRTTIGSRQKSNSKPRSRIEYHIAEPSGKTEISDLFITHAHFDHVGFAPTLRSDIPMHVGDASQQLLFARLETAARNALEIRLFFDLESDEPRQTMYTFRSRKRIKTGHESITVTPLHVDHSIPGAYGFILDTPAGHLAYTGDFRRHGAAASLSEDFIEQVCEHRVSCLICEGTNLGEAKPSSEHEVQNTVEKLVEKSISLGNRLVIAEIVQTDLDRVRTLVEVAKKHGMKPLLSRRLAFYLHRLRHLASSFILPLPQISSSRKDAGILVSNRQPGRRDRLFAEIEEYYANAMAEYAEVESYLEEEEGVMIIDGGEIDLFDLRPPSRALCILSSSEPFAEEAEFDFERWINQLTLFGVYLYHVHASGHLYPLDLEETVRRINPKILIPIHTNYPEFFREMVRGTNIQVRLPEKSVPIQIS